MAQETLYWAMIDGQRVGPMDKDALLRMNIGANTPVWYPGLPDWCMASDVEELAAALRLSLPPVPPAVTPVSPYYQQTWPTAPLQQESTNYDERYKEPMPPTYLAWSIVTMILCCLPTGIVAIIFSSKVSGKYASGDYAGAKNASEAAAIWILVTVVAGLIFLPFQVIFSLL